MTEYTYTDADWRENAKYGLVGVTADDATEHWDRWLAAVLGMYNYFSSLNGSSVQPMPCRGHR